MNWRDRAACADLDPSLFHPQCLEQVRNDEWTMDTHPDVAPALEVCAGCPVRTDCLEWAMALEGTPERLTGVVGGTTPSERRWRLDPAGRCRPRPGQPKLGRPRTAVADTPAPGGGRRLAAPAPCGTRAAAERHRYYGEDPCPPCLKAERAYNQQRKAASRQRQRDAA